MTDDDLRQLAQELLDAEEANRLRGPTLENQSRLARARRRVEDALRVGTEAAAAGS